MAKINHPNFIDSINDLLLEAKKKDIILLTSESDQWKGDVIRINNTDLINFGTCGYLGLEMHPKIIAATVDFAGRFGTQFSISRSYVMSDKNKYLEDLLSRIFNDQPVIAYTSTSIAHISIIPIVIGINDLVILDQQVHISIQTATQLLSGKGIPIDIIRHSKVEMLEKKIKESYDKFEKIWYMVDGVYSMYGDIAPIKEINALMKKYDKLHLYVDDAHGMSWHGKNGCGRLFEDCVLNGRTLYVSTLAKGFGTMGGIAVFPDKTWYNKVCMHGGPLAYSHPMPPPMLGASIASAEIHLSGEIELLQSELKQKINYTQELLNNTNIPVISNPETPIFFIGTGTPAVGYNLIKRMLNDGFYVNLAMFPVAPLKNTGMRFTINNHISEVQIKKMIERLNYHYPLALKEEGKTLNEIRKAFGLKDLEFDLDVKQTSALNFELQTTISNIDKEIWNEHFADKGNFDWDALKTMEAAFCDNERQEDNWEFYYIKITDNKNELILLTFFTVGLYKDDMLSPSNVSINIEEKRKTNPYYLCSKTLSMGSLFTEGEHLYLNRNHPEAKLALTNLIEWAQKKQEYYKCNSLIFRDFKESDIYVSELFHNSGFFKMQMPNTNIIDNLPEHIDLVYSNLNQKNKKHFRQDVLKDLDKLYFNFQNSLNEIELKLFNDLYKNIVKKNHSLNIFEYPLKLFKAINGSPNWEFLVVRSQGEIVSIGACYKGKLTYSPLILGLDYTANKDLKLYKKVLFWVIERAIELKSKKIYLGLSADLEKRKLGAISHSSYSFISLKDNYNYELLNLHQTK
jgi:7-keto-8-aminopelargonate synthetase-like enzyme